MNKGYHFIQTYFFNFIYLSKCLIKYLDTCIILLYLVENKWTCKYEPWENAAVNKIFTFWSRQTLTKTLSCPRSLGPESKDSVTEYLTLERVIRACRAVLLYEGAPETRDKSPLSLNYSHSCYCTRVLTAYLLYASAGTKMMGTPC